MNRVSALTTLIPKTCVRRFSQTQIRCDKFEITKLKKRQIQFQEEGDAPIYLKGGSMDYILYFSTLALIVIGIGASAHSAYMLATKK